MNYRAMISIRDASAKDVGGLLSLWAAADATPSATDSPVDLERAIVSEHVAVLVAEHDGLLIGSVIGAFDGWRGNIYRLAVHPDHRRRRVGRMLLAAANERLQALGAKRVTALVEKGRDQAVAFWESTGYSLDDRIVRYVGSLGPGSVSREDP